MLYNWYPIFNLDDFNALGLVSRTYTFDLIGQGIQNILACKSDAGVSVLYKDTFLPVDFEGYNPYKRSPYALKKDDSNMIWVGVEIPGS